jgi:hypothetical protein
LEEKYDKKLRRLANTLYGGRKGAMSDVVEKGIELLEEKTKRDKAYKKLLVLSKSAKAIGIGKFRREESYAR